MHKFLIKIILFLLPVFLLILFVELQYRRIPNEYSYKSQYIEKNGVEIEILVLGSSHSYYGVNPAHFDQNCFNAALNSQSINYDHFLLNNYIDKLSNLKYVILNISYPSLTSTLEETPDAYRKYYYMTYMDYKKGVTLNDMISWNYYLMISTRRGITVLKRLSHYLFDNENYISCDTKGWGEELISGETNGNLKGDAKVKARRHEDNSFDLDENKAYLNDIIQLCKNYNIKLLLFTPPFTSYYVNALNAHNWEKIRSKCDSLEKQYSNVRYISFLNDTTFTDSLFMNADHLNVTGSKILSEKINKIITKF